MTVKEFVSSNPSIYERVNMDLVGNRITHMVWVDVLNELDHSVFWTVLPHFDLNPARLRPRNFAGEMNNESG